ncbi:MAG TPA: response regulator [Erysipelothrix sp.]|nr:response regulator [Erysipelothrix sp.]
MDKLYKVLIVEDEEIIRTSLVYDFPWKDHNCIVIGEASNGEGALSKIEEHDPDILLLDINMPIKDGIALLEETNEFYSFATIIISGYSSFEYAKRAISFDVVGYLTKPIDMEELSDFVEKAKLYVDNQNIISLNKESINKLKHLELIEKKFSKKELESIVQDVLDIIHADYKKRITMNYLSEKLHYSETFINRKFKEGMNTTINEYLNKYRIQVAINMIRNNKNYSIRELAYESGIPDYKYFNSVFRKYIGMSVKEFIINVKD